MLVLPELKELQSSKILFLSVKSVDLNLIYRGSRWIEDEERSGYIVWTLSDFNVWRLGRVGCSRSILIPTSDRHLHGTERVLPWHWGYNSNPVVVDVKIPIDIRGAGFHPGSCRQQSSITFTLSISQVNVVFKYYSFIPSHAVCIHISQEMLQGKGSCTKHGVTGMLVKDFPLAYRLFFIKFESFLKFGICKTGVSETHACYFAMIISNGGSPCCFWNWLWCIMHQHSLKSGLWVTAEAIKSPVKTSLSSSNFTFIQHVWEISVQQNQENY